MTAAEPLIPFTEQQTAIIELIGRLWSYKRIGKTLGLAEATVKQYVKEIAAKFDGEITDEERAAGPYKLILAWAKKYEGVLGHALTKGDMHELVQAKAKARIADRVLREHRPK